ncbi:SWI2/SNF2-containing protein [Toxoplasma gondii p89]|uniref:SWI2/SNF2-containing protein n=1 Tax=Toxoplasma gondii p89 TaxID=943119 RepID=A0A086JFR7_TOXGO|nr:SWI2/SNF2-containing protein [Toxoplasma gondii p89]
MWDTTEDFDTEEETGEVDEELAVNQLVSNLSSFLSSVERRQQVESGLAERRRKEIRGLQGVQNSAGNVLHSYQEDGVLWLIDHYLNGVGAIVADEMGLGKTLQSLAFVCWLNEVRKAGRPSLVVCPLSVVSSWEAQLRDFIATAPAYIRIGEEGTEQHRWRPSQLRTLTYVGSAEERHRLREKIADFMIHQSPQAAVGRNQAAPFDLLLTTYETLMCDIPFFSMFEWECVFFDEASRLKSKTSKRRNVFLHRLRRQHVVMMTGTPVENNLEELWSLLHFVQPSVFTSSAALVSAFCSLPPSLREAEDGRKRELPRVQRVNRNKDLLQRLVKVFILRRTLSQVQASWSLPSLIELVVFLPLTPLQRRLYFWLLTREREALEGVDELSSAFDKEPQEPRRESSRELRGLLDDSKRASSAAKQIVAHMKGLQNLFMQLRKCCNHPALFHLGASCTSAVSVGTRDSEETRSDSVAEGDDAESLLRDSSKIAAVDAILSFYLPRQEKVVVFSFSTAMLDLVEDYLDEKGIVSARLDGRMGDGERRAAIAAFSAQPSENARQSPQGSHEACAAVFLVSVRAGGYGLTLSHCASVCVFLEGGGDGNPQVERQAIARLYRQGQTKKVKVIRLITRSTVEEVMYWRGRQKLKLVADVLSEDENDEEPESQGKRSFLSAASMKDLITCGLSSLAPHNAASETKAAEGQMRSRSPASWQTVSLSPRDATSLDASQLSRLLAEAESAASEASERRGKDLSVLRGDTPALPNGERQADEGGDHPGTAAAADRERQAEEENEESVVCDLSERRVEKTERGDSELDSLREGESSIYVYEGKDYAGVLKQALSSKKADRDALQRILEEARREEREAETQAVEQDAAGSPGDGVSDLTLFWETAHEAK